MDKPAWRNPADALRSERSFRKEVEVQLLSRAPGQMILFLNYIFFRFKDQLLYLPVAHQAHNKKDYTTY